jgi:hypothetical protein
MAGLKPMHQHKHMQLRHIRNYVHALRDKWCDVVGFFE